MSFMRDGATQWESHLDHLLLRRILEAIDEQLAQRLEPEQRQLNLLNLLLLSSQSLLLKLVHCSGEHLLVQLSERREGHLGDLGHEGAAFGHAVRGEGFDGFVEVEEGAVEDDAGGGRGGMGETDLEGGEEGGRQLVPVAPESARFSRVVRSKLTSLHRSPVDQSWRCRGRRSWPAAKRRRVSSQHSAELICKGRTTRSGSSTMVSSRGRMLCFSSGAIALQTQARLATEVASRWVRARCAGRCRASGEL